MDAFELIKTRRSVFPAQFDDRAIKKSDIEKILEAANWAPTHKKTEPWRFKIMRGVALERLGEHFSMTYSAITPEDKFSDFKKNKVEKNPTKAQAVIAICMQRDPKERVPEWEEIAATAMAVQNLWLMAHSLGIGGYWSSPTLRDHMEGFLNLAEGERCLGFFYLGYANEVNPVIAQRGPVSDKTTWM